ncbi:ribosomal protein S18 acetylase RimI-like enzyme [Alkalihalobacillus xiaoxiensis]|uniref:Ribosomal protein S18 acetylase RimI-like enzyme n=1 Tax=Shouchella xiaoxiensis TaxID=766895 RepID=A0ABS2SN31_9BACI|nr:GNAT family N-acetyltransferase [Shouchella xiaoxiensis]MBM7836929.1 ribosomal protein S18 acetylase RimI-like enzyme [Shouchella xiaoxiensis]
MNVKQATIDDLAAVAKLFDLYRQFYQQESNLAGAEAYIMSRIEKEESVIFVVQDEQEFVGFTHLYPTFSSISMQKAWVLNDLYVEKSARGKGVGEQLLHKAEAFAKETGAKSLSLSTAPDNASAQRLYEKNGYKRDSEFYYYELVL